jgi:hypothetical protein
MNSEDGAAFPKAGSRLIGAIPWLRARRPGEWDYEGSTGSEPPSWGPSCDIESVPTPVHAVAQGGVFCTTAQLKESSLAAAIGSST